MYFVSHAVTKSKAITIRRVRFFSTARLGAPRPMLLCVTCSKPVKILVFKGLISQYNRFPQPTKGGQQIKLSINSIDNFDIYIYIYKVLPSLFYDASNSL